MVWQGKDGACARRGVLPRPAADAHLLHLPVIKTSRVMIGTTNPLVSPPGTVRGDLAVNVGRCVLRAVPGWHACS